MTTATQPGFLARFNSDLQKLLGEEGRQAFSGRGIVIAAGGASMFTNAFVLIHVLRHHLKCQLPIEVWHFGMSELSPRMQGLLHALDVTTVDAMALIEAKEAPIRDGWQLKSFALLWSRFAEILLLDADQVPAVDPGIAFEWGEYQDTGAIFWPDIIFLRKDNPIWDLMGLPAQQLRSFESGQLLVDKRRHWKALSAAYLLNAAAEQVYQLIYGDKDTFLIAWLFTHSSFTRIPHVPFGDECGFIQRDFSGDFFLQHRTSGKWRYSGAQVKPQVALHEPACLAALAELRANWNGRIFLPPDRGALARQAEQRLNAYRFMRFETEGEASFLLELLPDGELGQGRNQDRQNWAVIEDGNKPECLKLLIFSHLGPTCELVGDDHEFWRGERLWPDEARIVAFPTDAAVPAQAAHNPTLVDDFLNAANFFNLPDHDDELAATLALLDNVESGVEQRLMVLSETWSGNADIAQRLARLVEAVKAKRASGRLAVIKNTKVLDDKYFYKRHFNEPAQR